MTREPLHSFHACLLPAWLQSESPPRQSKQAVGAAAVPIKSREST